MAPVEKAQFFWGGNNWCWYPIGWHGPGGYWCGYDWNNGYGWGGPYGWNGGYVAPGYRYGRRLWFPPHGPGPGSWLHGPVGGKRFGRRARTPRGLSGPDPRGRRFDEDRRLRFDRTGDQFSL